jgi:hypothetical protein
VGAKPERSEPDQADHCEEVLRADAPRGDGQRTVRQWATSVIALARIFWLSTKSRASLTLWALNHKIGGLPREFRESHVICDCSSFVGLAARPYESRIENMLVRQ